MAARSSTSAIATFNSKGFFAAEKDYLSRNQYRRVCGEARSERTARSSSAAGSARASRTAHQSSSGSCPRPLSAAATSRAARRRVRSSTTRPRGCRSRTTRFLQEFWDPAAVKVFAALPTSTLPNGQVTVPRGTGQDSNQFVAKVDQQLGANNQLSVRYFIDDFNNASQFLPENILSYTGPSLESDPRSQSIVTGWKRTMSSTLLNESTFGYNRLHTARRPHPDVPSTQDFGIRLPYYPRIPSVSEIRADGYFNFGDNLEASFPRDGFQFNNKTNWIKGRHGFQFGFELEYQRSEIYNDFRRAGHFISNGQYTRAPGAASGGNALADFLLGQASHRSTTGRASTRTIGTSIRRTSSRTTSSSAIASR